MYIDHGLGSSPVRYEADMKIHLVSYNIIGTDSAYTSYFLDWNITICKIARHFWRVMMQITHTILVLSIVGSYVVSLTTTIPPDHVLQDVDYLCNGSLKSNTTVLY